LTGKHTDRQRLCTSLASSD